MPYKAFQENLKVFLELIDQLPISENDQINTLLKCYLEQNIMMLNEIFTTSIDNLHRLQKAKNANDVICTQARFTNEISKKLTLSTQRFLNASLGQIADYNEWLKAHCDFATD
ncbi:MAG: hypothetical protein JO149_09205 [Gammaproteobacteria bacterium]|nr:hypothetical protein [Gammaproteobacteria bacterium]